MDGWQIGLSAVGIPDQLHIELVPDETGPP